jgi:ribosomal protein S18 acetylase RimI-like enzyme
MAGFLAFASPRLSHLGLTLRPATESDQALLAAIYATTRDEELRHAPWSEAQKRAFTDSQSQHQELHYALHYPAAERLVIERDAPIGRIYVDTSAASVLLMEVTLLPEFRGRSIGTTLMTVFLAYADGLGRQASLHVEAQNPARRMYERMGFVRVETIGFYEFMVREAREPS